MQGPLPDHAAGVRASAGKLNNANREIRALWDSIAGAVGQEHTRGRPEFKLGVIVNAGPNGEEDLGNDATSNLYWVREAYVGQSAEDGQRAEVTIAGKQADPDLPDGPDPFVFSARNLNAYNPSSNASDDPEQRLPADTEVLCFSFWDSTYPDSRKRWVFYHYRRENPNAAHTVVNVGSTGETEAADGTSVENAHDHKIVNVTQQTRTAYNDAGDEKLYAYYRIFTYTDGKLTNLSGETRVEIDAPTECEL